MAFTRVIVAFVLVSMLIISHAHPIQTDLVPDSRDSRVPMDLLNRIVQSSSPVVLIRSKRGGIINGGGSCPLNHGMTPAGQCYPCGTQQLDGCPDMDDEKDYES